MSKAATVAGPVATPPRTIRMSPRLVSGLTPQPIIAASLPTNTPTTAAEINTSHRSLAQSRRYPGPLPSAAATQPANADGRRKEEGELH